MHSLWLGESTLNEDNPDAKLLDDSYPQHFKSSLVERWGELNIQQVKVSLYTAGEEVTYFIFDGTGSDKHNWFSQERLVDSPYSDLTSTTVTNYFSIEGHTEVGRTFFINGQYGGCHVDYGWLVVRTAEEACDWDETGQPESGFPTFLYSELKPFGNTWNDDSPGLADIFAIFIKSPDIEHPCDPATYTEIDNPFRSVSFLSSHFESEDEYVCDAELNKGWYKFSSVAGNDIPTSCVPTGHCGTQFPAWINDVIPDVNDCKDVTLCINEGADNCCDRAISIDVMNCGDFNVYYLEPLDGCPAAYCAGDLEPCPPGQRSSNGLQPGCSNNYPRMEGDPTIEAFYDEINNYAYLVCSINYERDSSILYTVQWLVNNEVVKETILSDGHTDDILDENSYTLGSHVKCRVSCKYRGSDIDSPTKESHEQTIDIAVVPRSITVSESQQLPSHVFVRASVPMSCTIRVKAQRVIQGRSEVVFSSCLLHIEYDTFDRLLNVKIDAVRDFQQDGDQYLTVYFEPTGDCSVNVEPGYRETTSVEVHDKDTARCTSNGDPHFVTYDGTKYDCYMAGDFVLHRSTSRNFEVHTRTWQCWAVYCNCGVAIREDNEVVRISMCDGVWGETAPQLERIIGDSPRMQILRDESGKRFTVQTPSGSTVTIDVESWGMNVQIVVPSDDIENTLGLCGIFDVDRSNDYTMVNGERLDYTVVGRRPDEFCSSWKLNQGESLFESLPDIVESDDSQESINDDDGDTMCECFDDVVLEECGEGTGVQPPPDVFSRMDVTTVNVGRRSAITAENHENQPVRRKKREVITPEATIQVSVSWPTRSGITRDEAESRCRSAVLSSPVAEYCTSVHNVDLFIGVDGCVEDISLIDGFDLVYIAVREMEYHCEFEVLKNVTLYENVNGTYVPPSVLYNSLCYTRCSEQGRCENGSCHCIEGYGGADCSVDLSQPPSVLLVEGDRYHGLCDARTENCQFPSLVGNNLLDSNDSSCHYAITEHIDGDWSETAVGNLHETGTFFMSFREVYCQFPESIITTAHSEEKGTTFATVIVYVSNDRGATLSNGMVLTMYDSICIECNDNRMCRLKNNACEINGHCYSSGEYHPSDSTMQCIPDISQDTWTDTDNTSLAIGLSIGGFVMVVGATVIAVWRYKKSKNMVQDTE
uniref:Uncharacterized protein LOC102807374 n=1 Tax=Saccoglossus kowalevskii TaxID=10224 RepID=A0ABM0LXB8_SACKO|nr:PREDICTED: uncharacterized protein LOC102807374 [Saccoglossus kowalevskii]